MLDKKSEMWYNSKIGSQRPLASRKNEPPCCATRGYVDLVCQAVALSGANLRTLPTVFVHHRHPLLRHWGIPPIFGTCIGTS